MFFEQKTFDILCVINKQSWNLAAPRLFVISHCTYVRMFYPKMKDSYNLFDALSLCQASNFLSRQW